MWNTMVTQEINHCIILFGIVSDLRFRSLPLWFLSLHFLAGCYMGGSSGRLDWTMDYLPYPYSIWMWTIRLQLAASAASHRVGPNKRSPPLLFSKYIFGVTKLPTTRNTPALTAQPPQLSPHICQLCPCVGQFSENDCTVALPNSGGCSITHQRAGDLWGFLAAEGSEFKTWEVWITF